MQSLLLTLTVALLAMGWAWSRGLDIDAAVDQARDVNCVNTPVEGYPTGFT